MLCGRASAFFAGAREASRCRHAGRCVFEFRALLVALTGLLAIGIVTWVVSVRRRNAAIVDSVWSIHFLAATLVYAYLAPPLTARSWLVIALITIWAVRHCAYITWRNWGRPEDLRYHAIRAGHQPGYAWKSLYVVFVPQAVLAWIVTMPLMPAVMGPSAPGPSPLGVADALGVGVWLVGFVFESLGDAQLARFRSAPETHGKVMDRGLWRHTRHPTLFGEFCCGWGIWLVAASAGGAWSAFAPLLMTVLLLRVSRASPLERELAWRRPGYREYMARTNAFFPGPPRKVE